MISSTVDSMEGMRDQWERPEMRDALARRDIGVVFALLIESGMSQREIAELTRQNPSEVSEIIGGRQVMAYDLLERIAARLDIPRGYLGLAYGVVESPLPLDEAVKRVDFLAHAADAVVGKAVFGPTKISKPAHEATPVPSRAGLTDAAILRRVLDDLAHLEQQFGGGVVLPAAEGQLVWARGLLRATVREGVRPALFEAVALLHRRASCAAFDMGNLDRARSHVLAALELAHESQLSPLQAGLLYTAGRMEQYHGPPDAALRLFQFGYPAALASGSPRLCALLEVREARCYAVMGSRDAAQRAASLAVDNFHSGTEQPEWLRFFDESELYAAVGVTWAALGDENKAVAALRRSLRCRDGQSILYRSFDLAELAACHLRNGDVDEGVRIGAKALDLVDQLNSKRARDRLEPLRQAACRGGRETREIVARITAVRESAAPKVTAP